MLVLNPLDYRTHQADPKLRKSSRPFSNFVKHTLHTNRTFNWPVYYMPIVTKKPFSFSSFPNNMFPLCYPNKSHPSIRCNWYDSVLILPACIMQVCWLSELNIPCAPRRWSSSTPLFFYRRCMSKYPTPPWHPGLFALFFFFCILAFLDIQGTLLNSKYSPNFTCPALHFMYAYAGQVGDLSSGRTLLQLPQSTSKGWRIDS